jgi:FdrA protein
MSGTVVRGTVHRGNYRDSVELMGIAAELEREPAVTRAGLLMGTPANKAVLESAGLTVATGNGAGPNDLIVAVAATSAAAADAAIARAAELLADRGGSSEVSGDGGTAQAPATLDDALGRMPDANLAVISTPGTYATAEALRALKRGLNVFLFSDNVPIEDEIELKTMAAKKGLLVMGPDCGTSIVDGVPIGFANVVRRGNIGLIGASGTGIQQVTCLIDRFGGGISHALGTGGRDLDERVGGRTMLAAFDRLLHDDRTDVVVLISKPPSPRVAAAILDVVRTSPKPVVVDFVGGDAAAIRSAGAYPAATFDHAAAIAVARAAGEPAPDAERSLPPELEADAAKSAVSLTAEQREIRGLFSGGSLAGEAKLILHDLPAGWKARILDLGDDEYTVGRPHPMIDPRLRFDQILAAGEDPAIGVVLLDIVLGFASHPDPAGALVPAIRVASQAAASAGRGLAFVASVCGTEGDSQGYNRQVASLQEADVIVASSNSEAARVAARIATNCATSASTGTPTITGASSAAAARGGHR